MNDGTVNDGGSTPVNGGPASDDVTDSAPMTGQLLMDAAALDQFMADAFGGRPAWAIERLDTSGMRVRQPTASGDSRPGGTVSGPTLMTLSDAVAYMVVLSHIGPEALAVTSNLTINFLRRPRMVDLIVDATLLKLGRSLAVVDVLLHSEGTDDPVAQATVTYSLALVNRTTDEGTKP